MLMPHLLWRAIWEREGKVGHESGRENSSSRNGRQRSASHASSGQPQYSVAYGRGQATSAIAAMGLLTNPRDARSPPLLVRGQRRFDREAAERFCQDKRIFHCQSHTLAHGGGHRMSCVANQHRAAKERVRLVHLDDWAAVRLPGLAQQLGDRLAKVSEVVTPVAGRPAVSSRNIGVAVDRSAAKRNRQQASTRRQAGMPGLIVGVPALGDEAPAPAASRFRLSTGTASAGSGHVLARPAGAGAGRGPTLRSGSIHRSAYGVALHCDSSKRSASSAGWKRSSCASASV
jgi:hypothetical protein